MFTLVFYGFGAYLLLGLLVVVLSSTAIVIVGIMDSVSARPSGNVSGSSVYCRDCCPECALPAKHITQKA
jgi:hypothetical protein